MRVRGRFCTVLFCIIFAPITSVAHSENLWRISTTDDLEVACSNTLSESQGSLQNYCAIFSEGNVETASLVFPGRSLRGSLFPSRCSEEDFCEDGVHPHFPGGFSSYSFQEALKGSTLTASSIRTAITDICQVEECTILEYKSEQLSPEILLNCLFVDFIVADSESEIDFYEGRIREVGVSQVISERYNGREICENAQIIMVFRGMNILYVGYKNGK